MGESEAADKIVLTNNERSQLLASVILVGADSRLLPNISYFICSSSSSNFNGKYQHEHWVYNAHRLCKE